MTIPQAIEDAIRAHDWWGMEYGIREFFENDKRDGTIEELRRELQAEKAKYADLEGRFYDLQGSVNLGIPHQNRKGTGAHYADKIKKMGSARAEVLSVLIEFGAKDYASGMTTDQVAARVKEMRDWQHVPYPEDLSHSLGGRLSELQGLRLVRSETNAVQLKDEAEQKYRTADKGEEKWFLTAAGQSIEHPREDMNPHEILLSYEAPRARS